MLHTLYRKRRQQRKRTDNKTEICPECGNREALDASGGEKAEQEKTIAEIQKNSGRRLSLPFAIYGQIVFVALENVHVDDIYIIRLYRVSRFWPLCICGN